jgi:hypothetical protein
MYKQEDERLHQLVLNGVGVQGLIAALLKSHRKTLDPPDELRYAALKSFLSMADIQSFAPNVASAKRSIVIDERKDPNGGPGSTREWEDDGPTGYMKRPPTGHPSSIFQACLSAGDFIKRLNETSVGHILAVPLIMLLTSNKRQDLLAEKRTMCFILDSSR